MKKLILSFALLFSTTSNAYYLPQVGYQITPDVVTAQIYNSTGYPLFCQGRVYGYTQTGVYLTAWFSDTVLPFNSAYAYVYAYYPHYFVNAWSNIRCH